MRKMFIPLLLALAACNTTKHTTRTADMATTATEAVRVATNDSSRTAETTQTQDSTRRDATVSWSIQLSSDTTAPVLIFSLPDGSSFWSRAAAVSGNGKVTETRMATTQTGKTQISGKMTDSIRKSRFDQVFRTTEKTKEKDAPNAFLFYGFFILIGLSAFTFLYRRT